jgi:hypothetical protein
MYLAEVYGAEVSKQTISMITDRVRTWRPRTPEEWRYAARCQEALVAHLSGSRPAGVKIREMFAGLRAPHRRACRSGTGCR